MKNTISLELIIDAEPLKVWQTLTQPEYVKNYFYGSLLKTSWEEGSSIAFYNDQEDQPLKLVHGKVLKYKKEKILSHTLFPSTATYKDQLKNHLTVTYKLQDLIGKTQLIIEQSGFERVEQGYSRYQSSIIGWDHSLPLIKEIAESIEDIF